MERQLEIGRAVRWVLSVGVLLLATVLGGAEGAAQRGVTLDDVIGIVLDGHPEFERGTEHVRRSQGAVLQAESAFDWTVVADAGLHRVETPKSQGNLLTTDTETDIILGGTFGVSKRFENGVVITPGVAVFEDTGSDSQQALSGTNTRPLLNITVPLLGFDEADPIAARLRAARMDLTAIEKETMRRQQELMYGAVLAYWQALAAAKRVEIAAWIEVRTGEVAASVKQRVDRGELAATVYHDVAANMVFRSMDADAARQSFIASQYALASALGIDVGSENDLLVPNGKFPDLVALPGGETVANAYVDSALANRPDLAALADTERAAQYRLDGARNDTAPSVDMVFELNKLVVRYNMALGNSGAEGRLMVHSAAAGEARLDVDKLKRRITADVRQAANQLIHYREAYRSAVDVNAILDTMAADIDRQAAAGAVQPAARLAMYERVGRARDRLIAAAEAYAVGVANLRLAMSAIPVAPTPSVAMLAQSFRRPPALLE